MKNQANSEEETEIIQNVDSSQSIREEKSQSYLLLEDFENPYNFY